MHLSDTTESCRKEMILAQSWSLTHPRAQPKMLLRPILVTVERDLTR